jgi:hypothetical protein
MNNWIPKNKIVWIIIAVTSVSIVLYFVGLFMVLGEIKKIENLYRDSNSESFKEEKFWAITAIAEDNKDNIQTLRNFFIQKGDEVKFIKEIESLAKNSFIKLEIVSIDVKNGENSLLKENVNIKVKTEGSWRNNIYFIDRLKKLPFGISIEKIDLESSASNNWSGSIEFIIFREK